MQSPLLKLDLQFFSDEEFGAYDPQSAYEGIESTAEPIQVEPNVEPNNPNPIPEQTQPEFLDFGGRKVPATSEDLLGLHKDYTEQQRYITALQDQVNAYKQLSQVQQQAPQPQAEPPISSDVANWDEETWQKFYDQPQDVLGNLINREVQKIVADKIDPIIHEREWNNELSRLQTSYPDFGEFTDDIQRLVEQHPEKYADQQGGLEDAYFRAKAMRGMVQPSPDVLAQDPRFIQNYVLNNQAVQEQVLNQYFAQKQQSNQQIPNVMGRGGGFTPQTPESSPTTLREASRQFMKTRGYR